MDLNQYAQELKKLRDERDWKQFHSPKNLTMALTGEVGELSEIFQWMSEEDSKKVMQDPQISQEVKEELADVFSYVMVLANTLEIDILQEAHKKLEKTKAKYPVEKSKGVSTKYNKL
jgi:NTP pyrophosphatase (non-canonical NTP hydrolase)